MTENQGQNEGRTVGPRAGLASGIVGLGIMLIALPAVVDSLPAAQGDMGPAPTLAGMMVLMGVFVIIAGMMTFVVKD